ncbi:cytochrome c peroxidase, partial [Acinetobacter baumannii]
NGTQSCGSCHHQDKAFTDGLGRAIGSTGQVHPRGAQGLANVVYNPTLTWVNPTLTSLEAQLQVPLFSDDPVELGVNDSNIA